MLPKEKTLAALFDPALRVDPKSLIVPTGFGQLHIIPTNSQHYEPLNVNPPQEAKHDFRALRSFLRPLDRYDIILIIGRCPFAPTTTIGPRPDIVGLLAPAGPIAPSIAHGRLHGRLSPGTGRSSWPAAGYWPDCGEGCVDRPRLARRASRRIRRASGSAMNLRIVRSQRSTTCSP